MIQKLRNYWQPPLQAVSAAGAPQTRSATVLCAGCHHGPCIGAFVDTPRSAAAISADGVTCECKQPGLAVGVCACYMSYGCTSCHHGPHVCAFFDALRSAATVSADGVILQATHMGKPHVPLLTRPD
eukprot:1159061-Pelagomonas_calceolata.AAC.11